MKFMIIRPFYRPNGEEYSRNQLEQIREEGLLEGINYDLDSGDPNVSVDPGKLNRELLAFSPPHILKTVRRCNEAGGYNAIIVMGFLDPGFHAARMISKMPVIGICHAAVHLASLLSKRFSVVDTLDWMVKMVRENIEVYGLDRKVASLRSIGYTIPELYGNPRSALESAMNESIKAVEEDGAEAIIVGCGALEWMHPELKVKLKEAGYEVPLISPLRTAIETAKFLVQMKLTHSLYTYFKPETKK